MINLARHPRASLGNILIRIRLQKGKVTTRLTLVESKVGTRRTSMSRTVYLIISAVVSIENGGPIGDVVKTLAYVTFSPMLHQITMAGVATAQTSQRESTNLR